QNSRRGKRGGGLGAGGARPADRAPISTPNFACSFLHNEKVTVARCERFFHIASKERGCTSPRITSGYQAAENVVLHGLDQPRLPDLPGRGYTFASRPQGGLVSGKVVGRFDFPPPATAQLTLTKTPCR